MGSTPTERTVSELTPFQSEVNDWQLKTFPTSSVNSKIAHMRKEIEELAEHPTDASEMADIFILLLGVASKQGVDLLDAARAKMEINKKREWGTPDENGVVLHKKHIAEQFELNFGS